MSTQWKLCSPISEEHLTSPHPLLFHSAHHHLTHNVFSYLSYFLTASPIRMWSPWGRIFSFLFTVVSLEHKHNTWYILDIQYIYLLSEQRNEWMREKCKLYQIVLKNCSDIIKCFKEANKGKRFNSMEKVWVVCFPFIGKMCQLNIELGFLLIFRYMCWKGSVETLLCSRKRYRHELLLISCIVKDNPLSLPGP